MRSSLQKRHARDYSFNQEKIRELFEELLEQNIQTLRETAPRRSRSDGQSEVLPISALVNLPIEDCFVYRVKSKI